MKNMKTNAGSFSAKLQATIVKMLGIFTIVAVIGFSLITCDNGSDNDGNGGNDGNSNNSDGNSNSGSNGKWRTKKTTSYTVTDGVNNLSSESVYNWITYRYTSNTNYEQKYTINATNYGSTTNTYSQTIQSTRNGQTGVYTNELTQTSETYSVTQTGSQTTTYDSSGNQLQTTSQGTSNTTTATGNTSSTSTSTTTYDPASGLTSKQVSNTSTTNTAGTTTTTQEVNYTIQLLSDSGGVKTYRQNINSIITNGTSADISNQGYSETKIQNGRTIEQKSFTASGELSYTITYTVSDNAVIKAKLGDWTFSSVSTPTSNSYSTLEVVSDSATELVIRLKSFANNVQSSYTDYTYEKVN